MSKKPAQTVKSPSAKAAAPAPRKASRLKLALLAGVPLVLAGGAGYGGWIYLAGGPDAAQAGEPDTMHVASVTPEIAAESSFTHSYALSILIAERCGGQRTPALKAASDREAQGDGLLATLSWQAAARRTATIGGNACEYMRREISLAEAKAAEPAGKDGKAKAAH